MWKPKLQSLQNPARTTAQLPCAATKGAAHLCWDSPSPGPRHRFQLFGKEWSCPLRKSKFSSTGAANPSQNSRWCSNSIVGLSVLPLILLWTHAIIPWPKRIYATAWFLCYTFIIFSILSHQSISIQTKQEKKSNSSFPSDRLESPWIWTLISSYFFQAALHVWGKYWCAPNQYVITCARSKWIAMPNDCCCEKESTWLLTSSNCNLMAFLMQFYSILAFQTLEYEYTVNFG